MINKTRYAELIAKPIETHTDEELSEFLDLLSQQMRGQQAGNTNAIIGFIQVANFEKISRHQIATMKTVAANSGRLTRRALCISTLALITSLLILIVASVSLLSNVGFLG